MTTALVVIDMQVDVVAAAWHRNEVIATIASLVDAARKAGTPVIWVRHNDDYLTRGSAGWQIVDELVPLAGEPIIEKSFGDAFADTDLADVVTDLSVDHLVLVGAQSDMCVRSTFNGSLYRGIDVTLVSDAHTTEDSTWGVDLPGSTIVDFINREAMLTELPGVQRSVVSASEVDFAPRDEVSDEELLAMVEAEDAEEDVR